MSKASRSKSAYAKVTYSKAATCQDVVETTTQVRQPASSSSSRRGSGCSKTRRSLKWAVIISVTLGLLIVAAVAGVKIYFKLVKKSSDQSISNQLVKRCVSDKNTCPQDPHFLHWCMGELVQTSCTDVVASSSKQCTCQPCINILDGFFSNEQAVTAMLDSLEHIVDQLIKTGIDTPLTSIKGYQPITNQNALAMGENCANVSLNSVASQRSKRALDAACENRMARDLARVAINNLVACAIGAALLFPAAPAAFAWCFVRGFLTDFIPTAVPVLIECWKDCPPPPSDPLSALKDYLKGVGPKVPGEIISNIPKDYFKDLGKFEQAMAETSLKVIAKGVGGLVIAADTAEALKKTINTLMTDCKKTTTIPTNANYNGCCCTLGSPSECHCTLPGGQKVSAGVQWRWELYCYTGCASYCPPALDCHSHC
ncbi:unnamed protein product [Adineta ricciae]|nr:unnamed protein product [Adineta ricciae]